MIKGHFYFCDFCGVVFFRKRKKKGGKVYCDKVCRALSYRKLENYSICANCHTVFYLHRKRSRKKGDKPYKLRFCCRDCQIEYLKKYPTSKKFPDRLTQKIVNKEFGLTYEDYVKHDEVSELVELRKLQLKLKEEVKACQLRAQMT